MGQVKPIVAWRGGVDLVGWVVGTLATQRGV